MIYNGGGSEMTELEQLITRLQSLALRSQNDAIGKTIAAVDLWNENTALAFTDGTFLLMTTYDRDGVHGDYFEVQGKQVDMKWLSAHASTLTCIGIISKVQHKMIRDTEQAELQAQRRKEYERLKGEFEG